MLQEQRRIEASIKFPVRDELVTVIDIRGKPPLPLPAATNKLAVEDDIASDALMVWDCLHMFSQQVDLAVSPTLLLTSLRLLP